MLILDDLDRRILNVLQDEFPLEIEPYLEMAKKLNISEEELLSRIAAMKESGLIRRIGGIIDSRSMGFYSTLCAVAVPESRVEAVAAAINELAGVTHNYLRDYNYNIWFTLTVPSPGDLEKTLRQLEILIGLPIVSMPAQKVFKIKLSFDMESF